MAVVLSDTAVPDGLVAQIHVTQDAQRANLLVNHIVGPHHESQAPDGHRGKKKA